VKPKRRRTKPKKSNAAPSNKIRGPQSCRADLTEAINKFFDETEDTPDQFVQLAARRILERTEW
jgi:hypothetical protein